MRMASHLPIHRPHIAFVNANAAPSPIASPTAGVPASMLLVAQKLGGVVVVEHALDDRAGALGHQPFELPLVHVQGVGPDINKNRAGAAQGLAVVHLAHLLGNDGERRDVAAIHEELARQYQGTEPSD